MSDKSSMEQGVTGEGGAKTSTLRTGAGKMDWRNLRREDYANDAAFHQAVAQNYTRMYLVPAEQLKKEKDTFPARPIVDMRNFMGHVEIKEIDPITGRTSSKAYAACRIEETRLHPSLIAALKEMNVIGLMKTQRALFNDKHKTVLMNGQFQTGKAFAAVLLLLDVALRAKYLSGVREKGQFDVAKPSAVYMAPSSIIVDEVLDLAVEIRMHGDEKLQAVTLGLCYGKEQFGGTTKIGNSYYHTDIVFGCPGKTANHTRSKTLDMACASLVVFGEADHIFGRCLEEKSGFVKQFLDHLKEARARQEIPEVLGLQQAYITLASSDDDTLWKKISVNLLGEEECSWPAELCWLDTRGDGLMDAFMASFNNVKVHFIDVTKKRQG